jgi:hypothetical protein
MDQVGPDLLVIALRILETEMLGDLPGRQSEKMAHSRLYSEQGFHVQKRLIL